MRRKPDSTSFLNVDLDVWSTSSLKPLVAAFGQAVVVLHVGRERQRHVAHLELDESPRTADLRIRRFVALIKALPPPARRRWDQATSRTFNVGVQAASQPHSYELLLRPRTLEAAALVNAAIVLTVYAPISEAESHRNHS